jgi:hypothetical protein
MTASSQASTTNTQTRFTRAHPEAADSSTRRHDARVDAAITGALIGVGGVVLGVVLTAAVEARGRRHVSEEQREEAFPLTYWVD